MRNLLLPALGAAAVARWLPACLATLFTKRRVYRSGVDSDETVQAVLEHLVAGQKFALRLGAKTTHRGLLVPNLVVCPSFIAWVRYNIYVHPASGKTMKHAEVTVLQLPFLVKPLAIRDRKQPSTTIRVFESSDDDSKQRIVATTQLALPADADTIIPRYALENAQYVAHAIADLFLSNGQATASSSLPTRVFMLHGDPGSGKTTALRVLAHTLGATLYSEYDPRSANGTSIKGLLHMERPMTDTPLIIAYEDVEFSVFQNIDACFWKRTLDHFKYCTNAIFIMTTALSVHELWERLRTRPPAHDGMLLCRGRMDGHFILSPDVPPTFVPPLPGPHHPHGGQGTGIDEETRDDDIASLASTDIAHGWV